MPFVPQDRRPPLLTGDLYPQTPGDLCFLEYVELMARWREEPRWTTVNGLCKKMLSDVLGRPVYDWESSKLLAFLEFYFNHGHVYEIGKKEANGDI